MRSRYNYYHALIFVQVLNVKSTIDNRPPAVYPHIQLKMKKLQVTVKIDYIPLPHDTQFYLLRENDDLLYIFLLSA